MTRSTPAIHATTLLFSEGEQAHSVEVGSGRWFEWLDQETATIFAFHAPHGSYTARKERVGNQRGGWYWKAYRKSRGKLYRAYLGKSEELTLARLNEIAQVLAKRIQEEAQSAQIASTIEQQTEVRHDRVTAESQPSIQISSIPPLLETKLHPPQLPALLVQRARLWAQLDAIYSHRLTLVQAPAGFGKTTLINQWLAAQPASPPFAWVSLDASDDDMLRFWQAVITSCQVLLGQELRASGQAALGLLASASHSPFGSPPMEIVLTRLLNVLAAPSSGGLLVLDDYHVITEPHLHETLAFFIDHLPANVHVLLLSRSEPSLPLLRWRARGELHELHSTDLRFSLEETTTFLSRALPVSLSEEALIQLDSSLEGWAAGLRLLSLTLSRWRTSQAIEEAILSLGEQTNLSSPQRALLDYFVNEILEAQPGQTQYFLLSTSVLSRLSGPLCDAVTGNENSAVQLETIERAGLFLEALEGPGGWYRYHTFFAEVMRREASRRLGQETLASLSRRSSHWYEQNDMLTEAIEAAWLARDGELVARLVEQIAAQEPLYEPKTMLRWLELLPETMLQQRPMLCFIFAIAHMALREAHQASGASSLPEDGGSRIEQLLQMAEEGWRREGNTPWLGTLQACKATSVLEHGAFAQAIVHAQQALTLLPDKDLDIRMQIWHSACLLLVGMEKLFGGFLNEARPLILDALARGQTQSYSYLGLQIRLSLGRSHLLQGEFHQAQDCYRQVLEEARTQEDHELMADALLSLAWVSFEWNDLVAVEQQVQEAVEHIGLARHQRDDLQERASFQSTLLQYARGQTTETLTQLTAQLARLQHNPTSGVLEFLPFVLDWQGRFLLINGDLETVQHYLETGEFDQEQWPFIQKLSAQILAGRLLLANGQAEEALSQLKELLSMEQVQQHRYYALEIQLLLALAHGACKQKQQSRHILHDVLRQARSEGLLRLFLREGEPLARLLRSLLPTIEDNTLRAYIQSILHSFPSTSGIASASRTLSADNPLFEPLTAQEERVLRLLVAGCSNQEIAQELIVSINTVKDHVKKLYRKLGVSNRLQASAAAQLLKLT